jgi:methionyl-tRNA formyltransferase
MMTNNHSDAKIIFWGTSEFAIPSLETLIEYGYRIAAVVTNPDALSGRKRILTPPAVKKQIVKSARPIEILQPEDLTAIRRTLLAINPDLYIVAAYGKILPKAILDIPKYGALNIHPSLLPRWRGPAPIQYTILNGDAETGVAIIKMDEKTDHGPIIAQRELGISKLQIANSKPAYTELYNNLANLGAELLIDVLPKWIRGEIAPVPQDESKATYSKILTKANGRINWTKPAEEIERMIRAFNPWPGSWTIWTVKSQPLRLRIEQADLYEAGPHRGPKGTVSRDKKGAMVVVCGRGNLEIKKLTPEGSKAMSAGEFLHGRPDFIGAVLV